MRAHQNRSTLELRLDCTSVPDTRCVDYCRISVSDVCYCPSSLPALLSSNFFCSARPRVGQPVAETVVLKALVGLSGAAGWGKCKLA
jgi:hypothetical protein